MGRRAHSRTLNVWMNGQLVGRWTIPARGPMEFQYDRTWIASPQARPLSLSLPIPLDGQPLKGPEVGYFFDNLLPDSQPIRSRLQQRFRTDSQDAFDLLSAIGRDCVGAVQLLPENMAPENVFTIQAQRLTETQIEKWLVSAVAPESPAFRDLNEETPFRISLAGTQEKTAFIRHEGHWCRPLGTTPTTHIFKLPLGRVGNLQADMHTSVENEWLCSEIVRAYGVPAARCEMARFGQQKALIVERFDRKLASSGDYWLRLPQEDCCQALGRPGAQKYEADGGPGIEAIARLLATSDNAAEDLETFLFGQLIHWMLAATDAHAKNFSIFLLPGGKYRLAPFYDILSVWPITGRGPNQLEYKKATMAMSLSGKNRHRRLADIQRRHFIATAQRLRLTERMETRINAAISQTPAVIEAVGNRLPADFPMELFDAVTKGMTHAAQRLQRGAAL